MRSYLSVFEKAGALFESIAQNHAFYNGDKRTAFLSLTQLLYYSGYRFEMASQKAQANFTVDVVNKKYIFSEMVTVIENNSFKNE